MRSLLPLLFACSVTLSSYAQEPELVVKGNYRHYDTKVLVRLRTPADPSAVERRFSASAERLFPLPIATLDRWHRESAGQAAHLGGWFRLNARDANHAASLLRELRTTADVVTAYYEPIPELPQGKNKNNDIPPVTPLYTSRQGYMGKPPAGIHTAPARVILGGRGQGVQVADMEPSWVLNHEDVCQLTTKAFLGRVYTGGHHGLAVCGEYASDRNRYGTTGIVDQCVLKVSSWNDGGVSGAIARAANASKAGDLVILEVHYRTSYGYVPAEYFTSNFNVIKSATSRGIHIIEAGGNGNNDLDDRSKFGRLFDLTFRDSGAVMVGASNGPATARAGFSNHGTRITANGWGYQVVTTGYGRLFKPNNDVRQYYTSSFSGTSSASPIVAGAVASFVGAVKFQNDRVMTVNEVRALLRKHGTPCTGKIQNRPDIVAMLKDVGLPDGLAAQAEIVQRGGSIALDVEDGQGRLVLLYLADKLARIDVNLNRKLHLDPARWILLPPFVMTSTKATVKVPVPNDPRLIDWCLYFQALTLDAALKRIKLTSSTEVWLQ